MEEQELEDYLSDVLTDSMDMDWTSTVGAKAIVNALEEDGYKVVKA